jgi:hypothetical protein
MTGPVQWPAWGFPQTDPDTEKMTGWFGRKLPKNAASSWNPLATPLPRRRLSLRRNISMGFALGVRMRGRMRHRLRILPSGGPRRVFGVFGGPGSEQTRFRGGGATYGAGDYDGRRKTDIAIFRHRTGNGGYSISSAILINSIEFGQVAM